MAVGKTAPLLEADAGAKEEQEDTKHRQYSSQCKDDGIDGSTITTPL